MYILIQLKDKVIFFFFFRFTKKAIKSTMFLINLFLEKLFCFDVFFNQHC